MTKKFVKADFNALGRKEQKPPQQNYYRSKDAQRPPPKQRARGQGSFQQKTSAVDLRKYFEVCAANEEIKGLIEKFPGFFVEISTHPEQVRSGKPSNEPFKVGSAYNPNQQLDEDDNPGWQSEGEVELGEKISQEVTNRVQNIERKNIGELKQYEKQFLEEELRRRMKQQEEEEQARRDRPAVPAQHQGTEKRAVKSEDSDEEVDIRRIIQITQPHGGLQRSASVSEEPKSTHQEVFNIAEDEPEDDNRFNESSNASDDDDIFGSGSDKEKEQTVQTADNPTSAHGHIKFVRGQFSMFALSRNIAQDQPIWSITNDTMTYLQQNLTSEWMDLNYSQHRHQCPLVCFDSTCNNYIPYEMFHMNHDIKFFQSMKFVEGYNKKLSNNKKSNPQNFNHQYSQNNNVPVGTYQPRKLSGQDLQPEPVRQPGRKYSNNYKPKPQQK